MRDFKGGKDMKSRLKMNKDVKKAIELIQRQNNRSVDRGAMIATLGMCVSLSEIGICDNTIKRAVKKMYDIVENIADEMINNKVSYGTSNHQNVDTDTNRDKLHEMCLQYGFDFGDDILIREEIRVGTEKVIL